ncbi:MAG TPA: PAS domain S-box protein [Acidimicrobiales bacterium]
MGIFVQQARSEIMGGADRLAALLRGVAIGVGLLGAALAVSLGIFLGRRSRRLEESERQLIEGEAESRRRLERILDAIPVGIVVATADGSPHYANREAEQLLGDKSAPSDPGRGDLVDLRDAYITGTDDHYPATRMPLVKALQGETSNVDDMEIRRADATVRLEVSGAPVMAGDNSVEFGIAVFVDIVARKQAQEAQARLASIVEASSDAILAKTLDGIVTSWNPGAERLFGYSAAEIIGRSIEVLIPKEGVDSEERLRRRVAHGLGVEQFETVWLRKDGTRVDVSSTLSPIIGADGKIAGIATICRDISERKQAEAALAGAEARFRSLAQNSTDVITIVDSEGRITYQSSSVERVFGLQPEHLLGRPFTDWVHPDDVDAVPTALRVPEDNADGRVDRPLMECRLYDGDGAWRYVETALNNRFDDSSVKGLVLNSRDVSERHQLEEEIRHRSLHDALTGLANRVLFADRVGHALDRAGRQPTSNAVVYLDIDGFKAINDSRGHAAGDLILQAVARRLLASVRPQDTVARLGGDEFAILLEDASEAEAVKVARRMNIAVGEPFDIAGEEVQTGASIGIALAAARDNVDDVVHRADAAMYGAKQAGGGGHRVDAAAQRTDHFEEVVFKTI